MKESLDMREHTIKVDHGKCIGCGLCRRDCPVANISIIDKKAVILAQDCIKCGHCVAVCPRAAVSMTGYDEAPVEIGKPVVLDPRQLLEAIRSRRSIRHFIDRPVPEETIHQIIEAGRYTPTGKNAQDVSYIVLKEHIEQYEKKAVRLFRRLAALMKPVYPAAARVPIDDHFFFKKAPAVILILSKDKMNGALAASNMELMAEACGLGVLYSGFFALTARLSPSLRKSLGLKHGEKVVTALVLGYSGVTYRRTAQKDRAVVRRL